MSTFTLRPAADHFHAWWSLYGRGFMDCANEYEFMANAVRFGLTYIPCEAGTPNPVVPDLYKTWSQDVVAVARAFFHEVVAPLQTSSTEKTPDS